MIKYDPKSLKAEEFINDSEINETLKYADENKDNFELIDSIIEKAKLRKGLDHREASVLLACEDEGKLKEIYALAEQIKKDFYGDRIVMFAPLYLSNYCVNGCVYCPYHAQNKHICRKKLTQEEVRQRSSPCRIWVTSVWRSKPVRIRSTIRSSTFWNVLIPFTRSSTKTARSAG